jgi:cell division septal protein FtsQ
MSFKKYESRRLLARKHRRGQRTWLFLALGGAFLVGLAFFIFQGSQNSQPVAAIDVTGAPSLKADQEQIDLGDVPLGQTVQVSFRLTNVGDQPLRFSEKPYIEVVEGC